MLRSHIFPATTGESSQESIEILAVGPANARIERIVSMGHCTPPDYWYDQPEDEWVMLLQGQATILDEFGTQFQLQAGDYLLIPAHHRHQVTATSSDPPCIWLAIHGAWAPPAE